MKEKNERKKQEEKPRKIKEKTEKKSCVVKESIVYLKQD